MKSKIKYQARVRRHKKVRAKVKGSKERPRLCVFKSSNHIYSQLINDENGKVLAAANDLEISKQKKGQKGKTTAAYEVGKLIAEKAKKEKISKVVFDRGGFIFQGKIKALAQGARDGGLNF